MTPFNDQQWNLLLTVGRRIVPEVAALDEAGRARFRDIVAEALRLRPESVRRQFRLFLTVVRLLPVVRAGAPFTRLSATRQDAFLAWLQDRAPGRLRQGFWGLRTLVCMGYYGQTEVAPSLSYTPSFSGNEMLRG